MKNLKFLFLLVIAAFQGCDEVDSPFPENLGTSFFIDDSEIIVDPSFEITTDAALTNFINNRDWINVTAPDNSTRRFIILEEFTGHTCSNCPRGTREITRLQGIFNEIFIPVGIHSGGFAEPFPPNAAGKYTTDFRVPGDFGETYDMTFSNGSYPSGIISRIGGTSTLETKWEAAINDIKDLNPKVSLQMNNFYDSTINAVRSEVVVEWKESLQETYNIQFYVLENNITDWQLDGQTELPDYKHKHVLRKVVNDAFGKQLIGAVSGETEKIQYIFPIDPTWNADEVSVVAFIFDSDQNSYEVIQANTAHIK